MEVTINCKRVTFRERIPLRIGARLPKLASETDNLDYQTNVPVMQILIESWEFPGDPADASAYDELDLFSEMKPLVDATATELLRRVTEQNPKVSASESSSG